MFRDFWLLCSSKQDLWLCRPQHISNILTTLHRFSSHPYLSHIYQLPTQSRSGSFVRFRLSSWVCSTKLPSTHIPLLRSSFAHVTPEYIWASSTAKISSSFIKLPSTLLPDLQSLPSHLCSSKLVANLTSKSFAVKQTCRQVRNEAVAFAIRYSFFNSIDIFCAFMRNHHHWDRDTDRTKLLRSALKVTVKISTPVRCLLCLSGPATPSAPVALGELSSSPPSDQRLWHKPLKIRKISSMRHRCCLWIKLRTLVSQSSTIGLVRICIYIYPGDLDIKSLVQDHDCHLAYHQMSQSESKILPSR
jgi:hypothetical protein